MKKYQAKETSKLSNSKGILDDITSPDDLKSLDMESLMQLAEECRDVIVETVSRTGGHLASSLGVIELTLALHYVFNTPDDRIIWDVGHQVYAHKLITNRKDKFKSGLRQYKGLSGFPKKGESEYDHYDTGHSGTSISFSLGLAEAFLSQSLDNRVIAVIGDGSMTAGVAFEALNHAGQLNPSNLIVVLNDNEMSISPNVGAVSEFISRRICSPKGAQIRRAAKSILNSIPRAGDDLIRMVRKLERSVKDIIQPGMIFEELGFQYLGPFDGHRVEGLIEIFENAKNLPGPLLIHVLTQKGKGYKPAEIEPERFHGASSFNLASGKFIKKSSAPSYTSVFGDTIVDLAKKDDRVVGITAAMTLGTGLDKFAEQYPDRFYDVGIAEQHAVTFAAGLTLEGMKPIVALYSTFLQRGYDEVFHDVCLQELPVIFALDRGGLVGADGPTHHGVFDFSYLRHLPGIAVMAPRNENELRRMFFSAHNYDIPVAIRYPRGAGIGVEIEDDPKTLEIGTGEILRKGKDVTIVGIGPLVYEALAAAEKLKEERINVEVIDAKFVKPLDTSLILASIRKTGCLLTIEENALAGGFGSAVVESLIGQNIDLTAIDCIGLPDKFIPMGSQKQLRQDFGLTETEIIRRIHLLVGNRQAKKSKTKK